MPRTLAAVLLTVLLVAGCAEEPGFTATFSDPVNVDLSWPDDDPDGGYTILHFVPPRQTTYRHPDPIPETRFSYRIRPFYGPVPEAAPGAFRAEPAPEGMVRFGWEDPSTDEDGFLVEIEKPGSPDFTPIEMSDPGTTSAVLATMPGEAGASYRLRAFYHGPTSPVLDLVSGEDG